MPQGSHDHTHPVQLGKDLLRSWLGVLASNARLGSAEQVRTTTDAAVLVRRLMTAEATRVKQLWESYNSERRDTERFVLNNRAGLVAYLLGFHLVSAARFRLLLDRLLMRGIDPGKLVQAMPDAVLVDLGCGSGALSTTLFEAVSHRCKLSRVELVDSHSLFAEAAAQMLGDLGCTAPIKTLSCGIDRWRPPEVDRPLILLMGYVWNECGARTRTKIQRLLAERSEAGAPTVVFFLDPANQHPCRDAMEWRQKMVEFGYQALYPCPHSLECPMLDRPRDWCYSEGLWRVPDAQLVVDKVLEVNRTRMASAAFVFACGLPQVSQQTAGEVVVGRPRRGGGPTFDYLVCTPGELKKHPANVSRNELLRGLVVPKRSKV